MIAGVSASARHSRGFTAESPRSCRSRKGLWLRVIFDHCRRIAAALALLGMVAYAALIPGHIVSQLNTALLKAELGDGAGDSHDGDHCDPAKSKHPNAPKKNCPFCAGFAAFQVALLAAAAQVAPPSAVAGGTLALSDESSLRKIVLTQSRGPPLPPV